MNITGSELYSMVGNELNKEFATIKLEGQDIATLKSLIEERDIKKQILNDINVENNSEEFKGLLATLLENEKKYQEKLLLEKKKKEQEKLEKEKQEEQKKLEEMARRQKALEEERKKEIERRTKQLLVEKQNPILMTPREEKKKEASKEKQLVQPKIGTSSKSVSSERTKEIFSTPKNITPTRSSEKREELSTTNKNKSQREAVSVSKTNTVSTNDFFEKKLERPMDDFFSRELKNNKIVDQGIPVIKNNRLDNEVVTAKKTDSIQSKVFPDIPLEKKDNIFPDFPEIDQNNSFFDENEFNDLSNYMEDDNSKKSWF